MYAKLFTSMYDGTLTTKGPWQALVTFQQFLILADKFGVVDMTPEAISRYTTIPLEIITRGIAELEKPDAQSRSQTLDGKRITRLSDARDWGWQVVNYSGYSKIRSAEDRREYQRLYQKQYRLNRKQFVNKINKVNQENPSSSSSSSSSDKNKKKTLKTVLVNSADAELTVTSFRDWWILYPKHVKRKSALAIWERRNLHKIAITLIQDTRARIERDGRWREGFIPDPTTYLNQERWNDDFEPLRPKGNESYVDRLHRLSEEGGKTT